MPLDTNQCISKAHINKFAPHKREVWLSFKKYKPRSLSTIVFCTFFLLYHFGTFYCHFILLYFLSHFLCVNCKWGFKCKQNKNFGLFNCGQIQASYYYSYDTLIYPTSFYCDRFVKMWRIQKVAQKVPQKMSHNART